jgi:molybdopterin/thiamine biosynthesis adenylyltransferase
MMALEAIKLITGAGEPLVGRVMLVDGLGGDARVVALKRDPACSVCSHE